VLNGVATERTGLLGNGENTASERGRDARKDSWVGAQEFEGLPWYKRPSVCDRLQAMAVDGASLRFIN
jgi:hypothetical protein